jgi:hypothetical protein
MQRHLQMGRHKEDRRFSLQTQRAQKRVTGEVTLRDRRWSSIFAKAVLPQQRQVGAAAPWSHGRDVYLLQHSTGLVCLLVHM